MRKNQVKFECTVNERQCQCFFDIESSTLEAREALLYFLKEVGKIEDEAKAQQEAAKGELAVVEEIENE